METKLNAVNEALKLPLAEALERDVTEELDAGAEIVLALIDLDTFMQVNERFGHDEGDRVLIDTGRYIRECLAEDARMYRYHGDEFALVFPANVEKEDVFLQMEALRSDYDVKLPDGTQLTLSIGIAAAPEDGARYNELLRKADGAMFRGKRSGRNRVCLAREEKMVTKTSHYTAEQLQRLTKISKREGIGEAILLREALDALLRKYEH